MVTTPNVCGISSTSINPIFFKILLKALLKGKVFDLQGDRSNAIEYYKKCIMLDNLSSAIKESKQYLKKPFTAYGS